MLLIGILSLILYSSYKDYTMKDLKEFIVTAILLILYTMIIL
jgi:Tfp pilus assembly protein PilE